MSLKPTRAPGAGPTKNAAWHDNVIFLTILRRGFHFETGAELADLLSTSEPAITRARQGKGDIAGLAPAVLKLLFPGVSEIALRAQLFEFKLRTRHSQMEGRRPPDDVREAIAEGWELLSQLRQWLREMRTPATPEKRLERETDRAALASLEGQLYLYEGEYADAAAAFEVALSRLGLGKLTDLGPRVLFVRSVLNWYFAKDKLGIDVSQSVMQQAFVRIASDVAHITGDSRLLVIVAEAHGGNGEAVRGAELLCDAAEMLDIPPANLPQHHPVGYEKPLGTIPAFKAPLELVNHVEARRRDAREKKSASRCDVGGSPLGSLPDDASLNLPGF